MKLVIESDVNNSEINSAIVIDDHPFARIAIISVLENEGVKKVYEAEDGWTGLKLIKENQPSLVILDIDIPKINGILVLNKLRAKKYTGIVIVVSAKNKNFYGKSCAGYGANAFVSKRDGMSTIISAIRATRDGYSYFPFSLNLFTDDRTTDMKLLNLLSLQELSVMNYIREGFSNNYIATEMNIGYKTVSTYKRRMMDKLNCKSTPELLSFLMRNDID